MNRSHELRAALYRFTTKPDGSDDRGGNKQGRRHAVGLWGLAWGRIHGDSVGEE